MAHKPDVQVVNESAQNSITNIWRNVVLTRLTLILASLGVIVALSFAVIWHNNFRTHTYEQSMFQARMYMEQFKNDVNRYVLLTGMLEAMLRDQNGVIQNFPVLARFIVDGNPYIRSLQLAPNGVVTNIYPEQGNLAGKIDLFSDPERRGDAIASRDSGRVMVSGPVELKQGGKGLIIRRPIYLTNLHGSRYFWGFAIIILDPVKIFDKAELRGSPSFQFEVCFDVLLPGQNKFQQVFAHGHPDFWKVSIKEDFLGRTWLLNLSPVLHFVQFFPTVMIFIGIWVVSILMGIVLSYAFFLRKTSRKLIELNSMLQHISIRDPLTGLLNRRAFSEKIHKWAENNYDRKACLVILDIDDFKRFNDVYGHSTGDQVLRHVSDELKKHFGKMGIVARTGGDEFMLFLNQGDPEKWLSELDCLATGCHESCADKVNLKIGTSLGCAFYPEDSRDIHTLASMADIALYHTKIHGKRGLSVYKKTMSQENRLNLGFNVEDLSRNIPAGILIYKADEEERILFASENLYKNLGFSSLNEFLNAYGNSFKKFVYPDDVNRVESEIIEQQDHKENENLDYVSYRVTDKNGAPHYFIDVGRLLENQYFGKVYFVILLEITKRAETYFKMKCPVESCPLINSPDA